MDAFSFSYPRYLTAKETVDERALNERVLAHFLRRLTGEVSASVDILEVGGGTGATLRRLLWRLGRTDISTVRYTLVDARRDNLEAARTQLREWASANDYRFRSDEERIHLRGPADQANHLESVHVRFRRGDFFDLVSPSRVSGSFDAVVAQALLDIVDIEKALRRLRSVLRDGGLWYLPIHFDGVTAFEPLYDPKVDEQVQRVYHDSMVAPEAGRRILTTIRHLGAHLRAVGASDWVVFAEEEGYPDNEKYFLQCILQFVLDEIKKDGRISTSVAEEWAAHRWKQIEQESLVYIAHQLDICAQTPA